MTTAKFHYVYFLSDIATGTHHYVGHTSLKPAERLAVHNSGAVSHTSKFRPWRITAAIAVESEQTAISLESYFKSHSGWAFANKHLFPRSQQSNPSAPIVRNYPLLSDYGSFFFQLSKQDRA